MTDTSALYYRSTILALPTREQKRLRKFTDATPEMTVIEMIEPQLPTLHEFMNAESTGRPYNKMGPTVRRLKAPQTFDQNPVLGKQLAMNGSLQKILPQFRCRSTLHLSKTQAVPSDQGEHQMSQIELIISSPTCRWRYTM